MVSANHIAGFLNFNISRTIGGIQLFFCFQVQNFKISKTKEVLKQILCMQLHIDGQACPGISKEPFKALISQKLIEV